MAVCKGVVSEQIVSTYLVSLSEELKKALVSDGECCPELIIGRSEILDIDDVYHITNNFIGKTQWCPIYSTSLHKRSLAGLYTRLQEFYENGCSSPILVLVKDTKKRVFGALLSTIFQESEETYELEHSILFHLRPNFQIFSNMRDHKCRVRSQWDGLSIMHTGGNGGELWLNSKLTVGRTDEELTQIILPRITRQRKENYVPPQDPTFNIKTVECWVFGDH